LKENHYPGVVEIVYLEAEVYDFYIGVKIAISVGVMAILT
jgi:hypothetical protein